MLQAFVAGVPVGGQQPPRMLEDRLKAPVTLLHILHRRLQEGVVAGAVDLRPEANEPDGPYLAIPNATGSIPVIIFHGL